MGDLISVLFHTYNNVRLLFIVMGRGGGEVKRSYLLNVILVPKVIEFERKEEKRNTAVTALFDLLVC